MFWHVLDDRSCSINSAVQLHWRIIWTCLYCKGTHWVVTLGIRGRESSVADHVKFFFFFFACFLAVLLELYNPGYSHYKSCCLDLRPQTGDRLCNLVSFSIPLGFTGRCLTLLAGYLLATLKATFLLTSQLGTHKYSACTVDASVHASSKP